MTDTGTATMWLHMLANGGRWSAAELAGALGATRRPADTRLCQMAKTGLIASYQGGQRANGRTYGVDVGCKVPQGVSLEQVLAAINPKSEGEA